MVRAEISTSIDVGQVQTHAARPAQWQGADDGFAYSLCAKLNCENACSATLNQAASLLRNTRQSS